ncbi:NnrU family protein [Phaeovulum sp.]|uniref:NnrU family protein n=1 Tax=Phaeovulum sp. TaxID=2934796 RepID=UPI0027319897|nr:NnrU family protein [Phaeovulum sp.]MDP1667457.1 NnrU family protein [Phaeovulum sp.]MDZ4119974.1 NnrU family protein [Phaeovulum sp.]
MAVLLLGLLLWVGAHLFKRLAPKARASMGDRGKAMVAGLSIMAIVLMVLGFRSAEVAQLYHTPAWALHANNALMLVAIFLLGAGSTKGLLVDKMRHPMLTGVLVWALAHLMVNGDQASVVLFGGLGLWAVAEMVLINRAAAWKRPAKGSISGDAKNLAATVLLYAVISGIHYWLGHNPFVAVL